MKTVALHNLGCKVNSYELEVMGQKLKDHGYTIVPFDQIADIYIINTCSVTNIADRKSRQMLHQAKKRNPKAIVVAAGCYAQTSSEKAGVDDAVDLIVGNNRKKDIVEILEEYFARFSPESPAEAETCMASEEHKAEDALKEKETGDVSKEKETAEALKEQGSGETLSNKIILDSLIDINHTDEYEEMTLTHTAEHTRAYIKIQDGCNQFCSYCIIPYARGRVRSRTPQDILAEVKGLVQAGYQEIVVTGIHLSSYGLDFDGIKNIAPAQTFPYERLLSILKELHAIEGLSRIRLGSLEPRIVSEEFAKALSEMPKICPHFHLSLQSGCDETLQRMNRHYTTEDFKSRVAILRKYFDNPAITTDVITGFPGETEEEFAKTKAFLEEICFYEMHVFPYSKRQGTVAAARKDQVEDSLKKSRSAELIIMEQRQSKAYREQFIGKTEQVLFEEAKEIGGKTYQIGHTMRYVKVAVPTKEDLSGQILSGRITGMPEDEILVMEL